MEAAGKHRLINSLLRAPAVVASRLRIIWLRALGAHIGKKCWLRDIWVPRNPWDIHLDEAVAVDRHVTLVASGGPKEEPRIYIGAHTYVNRYTIIDAHESIRIGKDCLIGPSCYISDADHSYAAGKLIAIQPMAKAPVVIEDGVLLGAGVTVLKGVTIGEGAVIGAGAVITKDVPANAVVSGVPGKVMGMRRVAAE
ncbi:succinyltransferase-like protein [Roseimicrobium gellanilyticum]|uniref:Succinyltransferase-like protein n=1 Tax=Roseimicrobium gellanilyticum TaxID=748857 RepID=A0A366H101_9BACT|nr:acyltransferase [Roseimicrobium gellanilyticum]RBP35546.1 succinyltransferase-like protein [Roseimicrobium gellanilyticum]